MESHTKDTAGAAILRGLTAGLLGVLALFHSLLGKEVSQTLWADNYDARLLHWIAGWGYKAIVEFRSLRAFWDAPSFYPHAQSLAFSDSLLTAQFFYTPLRLAGVEAFAALYTTLAAICVAAAVLSAVALQRIGGFSRVEQLLILYVSHFGLSISGYLPHYQLFGFQFAVPFLLFLYLVFRDWKGSDLVSCVFCFCAGTGIATYVAPMLTALGLVLVVGQLTSEDSRQRFLRGFQSLRLSSVLGALLLLAALLFFQLLPYAQALTQLPKQTSDEAALYSAHLTSLLIPAFGGNSLWYAPGDIAQFGAAERAFFPGCLLAFGLSFFLFLRAGTRWGFLSTNAKSEIGIEPGFIHYLTLLLLAGFVLALGPYFAPWKWFKLPFWFISWIVPGLERVRAPGRFGIVLGLPAVCLTICFLRSLSLSSTALQRTLWVFGILVLFETLPAYRTFTFERDPKQTYRRLATLIAPGTPIIQLPVAGADPLRTVQRTTEQLHGTLIHGGKIISGYGASTTAEATSLAKLDLRLQRGLARPRDLARFAKSLAISWIVIDLDRLAKPARDRWISFLTSPINAQVSYRDERTIIARLM